MRFKQHILPPSLYHPHTHDRPICKQVKEVLNGRFGLYVVMEMGGKARYITSMLFFLLSF